MRKTVVTVVAAALAVCLWAQEKPERVDLEAAHRIRNEAFGANSKVMDTAFHLSDVYGPRLTGSPGFKAAADWASCVAWSNDLPCASALPRASP